MNGKIILFLIVFLGFIISLSYSVKGNEVSVEPNYQLAHESGCFRIYFEPSESVKGWELEILFNPSKIQIYNVSEGDFFEGYSTFFTPNLIIDNVNGSATKLYNLIVGQGNVSSPGNFIDVYFNVSNTSGVTDIILKNTGVCNETMYLPLDISPGVVQVYGTVPPWDTNADGKVNYLDVSCLVGHYGEICNVDDTWDIRKDGLVNYLDVSSIVGHYGELCQE